jgi:pseudouridine-5'-phosphate glycosidase
MPADVINQAIDQALIAAQKDGIHGNQVTPYLLAKVKEITGGDSLEANIELVYNNARVAAAIAVSSQ